MHNRHVTQMTMVGAISVRLIRQLEQCSFVLVTLLQLGGGAKECASIFSSAGQQCTVQCTVLPTRLCALCIPYTQHHANMLSTGNAQCQAVLVLPAA